MTLIMPHIFLRNTIKVTNHYTNVKRYFHSSKVLNLFYEKDDKGGYRNKNRKFPSKIQLIRDGLGELKGEIALWTHEVKEKFETDPILIYRPGEIDVTWKFDNQESLKQWTVTSDKINNEGYSTCTLNLNKDGNAVFSGNLSTRVPKDGKMKRAGYCNIRTTRARKSFKRESYIDWTCYNMLVMRIRGDGRSYILNIATKGYFDQMWNDLYSYALFTRGGPYWQVTRIPFSKFFLSSKGRIQDKQYPLPLNKITNFGISAGDKVNGPFNLEIDYIGVEFDPSHTEEFAYEMYTTDKYLAAS